MISVEKIRSHDLALVAGNGRQRKAATIGRVTGCVNVGVAHALQKRVHRDAMLRVLDVSVIELQVADRRNASGR